MPHSLSVRSAGLESWYWTLWHSKIAAVAAGILLAALVWLADDLTVVRMSFTGFYLVPIGMVVWRAGRLAGILLAVACTAAWAGSEYGFGGVWLSLSIPWWNAAMHLAVWVSACLVLARLKRALDHERELARTDPVTGADNRRSFLEAVGAEMVRARRYQRPFVVTYLDLDGFKALNDRMGHEAGDSVLRAVSETLRANVRATDTVARLGGDEFIVLMPETVGEPASEAVDRLRDRLLSAMGQLGWPVTFSLGMVTFLKPPDSVNAVLKATDDAMYAAKKSGKDTIRRETYGA